MRNLVATIILFALGGAISHASSTTSRVLDAQLIQGLDTRRNFVTNSGAETNVAGAAAYADAAASSPVDGTGGSPTITVTRTTSSPLSGVGSWLITKDAANRQGEGVAWNFTVDRASLAKAISVSFDYEVASGTYDAGSSSTDPDLTAWVYGPTDGTPVLTQLAPTKVLGCTSGTICKFQANLQTAASGVAYRLILHEALTGTSAYTFKLDNISVSPIARTYGPPVTDWVSYTPTVNNVTKGTGYALDARWRRVGDSAQIMFKLTLGTTASASGTVGFTLPSGLTADVNKLTPTSGDTAGLGTAVAYDSSASNGFTGNARYVAARTQIEVNGSATGASAWDATHPMTWADGDVLEVGVTVPISGWSSNTELGSNADGRVVAAGASLITADQTITAGTPAVVAFNSSRLDTHGKLDVVTNKGRFTAPLPGFYRVMANIQVTMGGTAASNISAYAAVNGGSVQYGRSTLTDLTNSKAYTLPVSAILNLNAGDYVEIYASCATQNVTVNFSATNDANSFYVERISGPAQIAASETVAARYYGATATVTGSASALSFSTKQYDTHNAFSGAVFTCPLAGKYDLSGQVYAGAGSVAAGNTVNILLVRGTGAPNLMTQHVYQGTNATSVGLPFVFNGVDCAEGETLTMQIASSATSPVVTGSNILNFIAIKRIGN